MVRCMSSYLAGKLCSYVCFRFEESKTEGTAFFKFGTPHLFACELMWRNDTALSVKFYPVV